MASHFLAILPMMAIGGTCFPASAADVASPKGLWLKSKNTIFMENALTTG